MVMKVVEGSGGAAAVKKRRRDAGTRRRSNGGGGGGGGVSVRRRRAQRQVDAPPAPPSPAPPRPAAAGTPLRQLLAACRRAFGGPGTVPAPDDVAHIRGILDKMGGDDVHLQTLRTRPVITRTTIYECANFSIVIFLLPPGAVIPLHNHPGMTVFSKPLRGSLHVTAYDWVVPQQHRQADDAPGAASTSRRRRLAKVALDADLRAPCDALVLFPESGGNMHRFEAATPCAVLDVLGPPYSAGDRDCSYYQDLPCSSQDHADGCGS
ncbi:hypothetical protein BS78_01G139100 [Paspalum vaginatum]|nr:hypothetical protein BS78_01G139100 [Paspalum vaginatum]